LDGALPADGTGLSMPTHSSPKSFTGALYAVNSLLRSTSTMVSNSQSIGFFNIFLAPFIKNIDDHGVKSSLRDFLYDMNSCLMVSGNADIAINAELEVPSFLEDVKAVGPMVTLTNILTIMMNPLGC